MKEKNGLPKKCEIMGHKIEFDKIKNPHILRAVKERGGFIFNYSDNKTYSDSGTKHSDYYTGENYSERSSHSDCTKSAPRRHVDHTKHSDYSDTGGGGWGDRYYGGHKDFGPK